MARHKQAGTLIRVHSQTIPGRGGAVFNIHAARDGIECVCVCLESSGKHLSSSFRCRHKCEIYCVNVCIRFPPTPQIVVADLFASKRLIKPVDMPTGEFLAKAIFAHSLRRIKGLLAS
ncbi:unnamed protein product [Strongylus vulgaris]|uniref:Uncharacterized protein n=1 Tax=Strongylus vulgaris TaxID=40348 RepID=A0A3P7L5U8_STRVU|nr:unnamed protein product [Strongylus vulgaris]